ncbi:hypothetical protein AAA799N04_00547 [Marine Group I thaumarchaeote SCGC AAA799-N04]|uniref:Uncharacterized protein n=1 Tax=Marine Group I thaumarchaeote SCGC AAA799-N04 TaxID=1502293 RepID=A0A081RNV4_9ARCH|nr:hypothetical protein AAA799N04_00547 [Marine Group I thaumarchaeote SCGC AAA799-N04]
MRKELYITIAWMIVFTGSWTQSADAQQIQIVTDLGNVFVAEQASEETSSNSGQGGGGVFGNSGTFRTLDLAGQVIHGQGMTGKANSLKSYTEVDPSSDFATIVLDDDKVTTVSIPEFTKEFKYKSGSLIDVTSQAQNILGYSASKVLSGKPSVSITSNGIVISGNGKILLKVNDNLQDQKVRLSGTVPPGGKLNVLEAEIDLTNVQYDNSRGFLLHHCRCNPTSTSLDVLVSADASSPDVTGVFEYDQSWSAIYYHGKCCKGKRVTSSHSTQTVASDLVTTKDSDSGYRVTGDNTNPKAATIKLPPGGKLFRVNYNKVSDYQHWVYDKNGGPVVMGVTTNFEKFYTIHDTRGTYITAELNGGTIKIKGETFDPNVDVMFEVSGLEPNMPYEVVKNDLVGTRGITSPSGKISLTADSVDLFDDISPGGILRIYPDSMVYRGSFSTIIFDTINDKTLHIDDGHDRAYTAFAYVRLPFSVDAQIDKVSVGKTAIPYLDGNYQAGDAIFIPILPNTDKITMNVNGISATIRLQDLPDVTGGKPIPPVTADNSDFNADGSLASISADAGSAAFAVATDQGRMYAMVTMSVSGNSAFSQDVSLHFTPNPPPPPPPRDPLSVYVDVYKNGELVKSEMVYYDDKPIFTPLNALNGMSIIQATDYHYSQRTVSAMTLVDVQPGDFVEFFVRTHIYAEGIPIPYSLVPQSSGGTYSIDKVVSAATATAKIHHGSILTAMA